MPVKTGPQILCELNDWADSEVTRGKHAGMISKSRLVLAADKWNWSIGWQMGDADGYITGQTYHGNMRMLLAHLLKHKDIELSTCVRKIVRRLSELTKKTPNSLPPIKNEMSEEELMSFGKFLDDFYGTSFMRVYPPTVTKDLFGTEVEEAAKD